MKPQKLNGPDKAYGITIVKFGSTSERLRILVFPAKETWITTIRGCKQPYEKVVPDISSPLPKDAKFSGLRTAIYLLHENDHDIVQKISHCEGQMTSMLCELSKEKWDEVMLPR
ncbi:MAG: hypothetical protein ABSC47_00170 [Terracidiphilus sp.]|jgi:hypothetical protein